MPLVSRITGVNIMENSTWGVATTRAVPRGWATARYCATNSPYTIDTEVAISRDKPSAVPGTQLSGSPAASSGSFSRFAINGSAR